MARSMQNATKSNHENKILSFLQMGICLLAGCAHPSTPMIAFNTES